MVAGGGSYCMGCRRAIAMGGLWVDVGILCLCYGLSRGAAIFDLHVVSVVVFYVL